MKWGGRVRRRERVRGEKERRREGETERRSEGEKERKKREKERERIESDLLTLVGGRWISGEQR
jgi:hypothetical protein